MGKFAESPLAHQLLDGLRGIEIGASAHNSFGLANCINVDKFSAMDTVYKLAEVELCGEKARVDVVASGDELPFPDNSLDFVLSSHVLEHFFDPIKALKEWYRVIRPGGYIFCIFPHKERTFDRERPRTSAAELVARHNGCYGSVDEASKRDDHHTVWITEDAVEIINWLGWKLTHVLDVDDKVGNGFAFVVQK